MHADQAGNLFQSETVTEFDEKYIVWYVVVPVEQIPQIAEIAYIAAVVRIIPGLAPYEVESRPGIEFPSQYKV